MLSDELGQVRCEGTATRDRAYASAVGNLGRDSHQARRQRDVHHAATLRTGMDLVQKPFVTDP
jgi:hypothetical protein